MKKIFLFFLIVLLATFVFAENLNCATYVEGKIIGAVQNCYGETTTNPYWQQENITNFNYTCSDGTIKTLNSEIIENRYVCHDLNYWENLARKECESICEVVETEKTCGGMNYSKAKLTATNFCGEITQKSYCNNTTGTWWFELEKKEEGCNPHCVVEGKTGNVEINPMCTGLIIDGPEITDCPEYSMPVCENGNIEFSYDAHGCSKPYCNDTTKIEESVKCVFYNTHEEQTCNNSFGDSCTAIPDSTGVATCTLRVKGNKEEKVQWKSSCGGYVTTFIDGINEYAEFKCDQIGNVNESVKCVLWGAVGGEECYSQKGNCFVTIYDEGKNSQHGSCKVEVKGEQGETITWKSSCGGYAYTVLDGSAEYAEFKCATQDVDCECTMEYNPVCGINGVTYSNACVAKCEKIEIAYMGECKTNEEKYLSAKWECSNGKNFLEESKTCQPYSYWKELARKTCASYDNINCYKKEITKTNINEIVIDANNTKTNINSSQSVSSGSSQNVLVCNHEVVTNFSIGTPCEVQKCEKYEREDGCIITKCTNSQESTESIHCPQSNCKNQGISEVKTIKEKCHLENGTIVVEVTENGCTNYKCVQTTDICNKEEDIPKEKILYCKERGGEMITKVDEKGCLVMVQCIGKLEDNNTEINKEVIKDSIKLLELALKLESLKIELQKTLVKLKGIADYYSKIGELDSAENFNKAVILLEEAVQKVDSLKHYIKENVNNFSEEDAKYIISVNTSIKNEVLKEVLIAILG
jgi:hypothetical protein